MASTVKKAVMTIGTHDGRFHADEALACYLLRLLPEYKDSIIIRTRDMGILQKCNVVVDVGAVYAPEMLKFDHHQREFTEVFSPKYKTKLSSAGLIYKHFGRRILTEVLLPDQLKSSCSIVDLFYNKMYQDCIEEFDAVDNGISAFPSDLVPAFHIGSTNVFARVNRLNPPWNAMEESAEMAMKQFERAVELTGAIAMEIFDSMIHVWWPARSLVQEAYSERYSIDASGAIVVLSKSCPWKDHLFDLEDPDSHKVLYVVYPDEVHRQWMTQAVPIHSTSFNSRKPFPEPWRGIRGLALDKIVGTSGCVFVHASGFIGGHETKEGALAMVQKSLNYS